MATETDTYVIHMKRKNLKRKSAKSYPWRYENKREFLKASNETQQSQKKERKKLSPEARKQTRASESPKITSKKSILRFQSILFAIALVIERKKLSPEARKQTRAYESLKLISKMSMKRFPSFWFNIALVIERKKLAPEAQKQTRASESLKMTSKS